MAGIHKEVRLEDEICADLGAAGWLHDAADAGRYDRAQALFVDDAVAWINASQPKTWDTIDKSHGAAASKVVAERLRKALDAQGTLAVLRQGFEMRGLRHPVAMCQFKPALAMNADLQARYAANRLRVVRQVRYSVHHENSIDMVLFVNGIPGATAELKSHYTQSVQDANNTKEQFANSPDLANEIVVAVMDALTAHAAMSKQALESAKLRADMKDVLLGAGRLWEGLREKSMGAAADPPSAV